MNELIRTSSPLPLPSPRRVVSVRPGTMDDLPFIDALQKMHKNQVGFLQTQALQGKVRLGHVIIAEDEAKRPVGYCIGDDRYFKREDCGVIYHLNVEPSKHRSLVGATLVKAMFDRAAYGCRLFCCWCAQDIEANRFWESLGFIPLAFRAGSRAKGRVHIFWQKRIRAGDTTTPWWFPSKTSAGALGEERLVLPIPPGTHWSDAKPIILPGMQEPQLEAQPKPRIAKRKPSPIDPRDIATGGLRAAPVKPAAPQRIKTPRVKAKSDPKHVAAARELRDRYLEDVNSQLVLPQGKYDLSRAEATPQLLLQPPAAA